MNEQMVITEENKYSTKDIAKWVRQTLKKTFPGIKFSVRTEYYSMGSSIHLTVVESKKIKFVKDFSLLSELAMQYRGEE